MKVIKTDHLVIGSGIAGLVFAINISQDRKTLILTKKKPSDSNTNYAQGGIAAALSKDDTAESHAQDTIRAGVGLSKVDIVKSMVNEAPTIIRELSDLGVRFTKVTKNGLTGFAFGQEGGHSHPRIVYVEDHTGFEVESTLLNNVKNKVEIMEGAFALDLIIKNGECLGCYFLDTKRGDIKAVLAQTTLLATGGLGQIYRLTTNPRIATGDGIGMAFRAGLKIANMEFIQFHPSGVYNMMIDGRVFLISEAVRGEGGILKTPDGKPFMLKYDPRGCLAPRDIVARAIYMEMLEHKTPYVYLDVSYLDSSWIKRRFPMIYDTCLRFDLDITKSPIPVAPAAHYLCGGIQVNEYGKTSIKRLYSSGEVAMTGVHGANRLASNSLLEAMVFTKRAAVASSKKELIDLDIIPDRLDTDGNISEDKAELWIQLLKDLMNEKVGIVKQIKDLESARREISKMLKEIIDIKSLSPRVWELKNMLCSAYLIVESALSRQESRGLHYVIEYPDKDDKFLFDTILDTEKLYHEIISNR